jgi:hypothetical protein
MRGEFRTDAGHSVVLTTVVLSNSMPMNSGAVIPKTVLDINDNPVTPFSSKRGSGIDAVNQHHRSIPSTSIRVWHCSVRYLEVVLSKF